MEVVAEGLWGLASFHEQRREIGKALKCLEAICQSSISFFPILEVKTRIRIATLLLRHSHNLNHAKSHLERSQLLLKSIPSCFELKFRAYSLLSHCYHLVGAIPSQKQILHKALDLIASSGVGLSVKLWFCNFSSQLANSLIIEGDYQSAVSALENGYTCATEICYPELQMFFATSILHVHLMQWEDVSFVESSINKCDEVWESIDPEKKRQSCLGLLFYNELLHIFYRLKICDYKNASQHVDKLDAAVKADLQQVQHIQENSAFSEEQSQNQQQLRSVTKLSASTKESVESACFGAWVDRLVLAPPPIDGEWLPKSAVYALVDLMVVIFGRPKGLLKECGKRIRSGIHIIEEELVKLGITDGVREVDLQHSTIWVAGVYLMLLMHFLENKVAVELTRSEFVEAQEALVQMKNWFISFPTILVACEGIIDMLRGQYAHAVGCFSEAAFHFIEASKVTPSKSMQAMCQVYAAVSYICIGDAESSSQALDLIGPVYRMVDSFAGVREKTCVLYAYGLLLMKQQNLQEARIRLATGLQISHNHLGNLQLVSQYLSILGSLALVLHDTGQAREILRSSLTLARKLYDVPTQIWVLSLLTALYHELGESDNEMENVQYQRKKMDDLQKRLADAHSSIHHTELVARTKLEVQQPPELEIKTVTGPSTRVNLDIPESVGLSSPSPARSSSRLVDLDTGRRGKRKTRANLNPDIPESVALPSPSPTPSSSRLVDLDTGRRKKRKS